MLYVFVYGTLRAGEINDIGRAAARNQIDTPRLIGSTSTHGRLYDFGRYPGLVPDGSAGAVRGDVYEIDEALVPVLDEIEGIYPGGDGLFLSKQITVMLNDRPVQCLFYPVGPESVANRARIQGGDWIAYRVARDAEPELKYGS
ncbi:gamma-glutamylcyclotransferase family protein [Trinickia fusca]|uniref:Gamma-glutamylcyclotransferase n=1 Tax=Trinickia fusca TaxID=2419777 RepID=A0A494XSE9_9BURK|nr:gamma-glutamylcyclotransferase family protein [Trinickia fusca]RKP52742.1 gamma-glutamylcyclotransferase [Trinickia fusca]